jgi:hypothetical protein
MTFPRLRARRSIGGLLAMVVLLAACGPLVPTPTVPTDPSPMTPKQPLMAEFDRNLAIWQASGITRYAFVWTPSCFCLTAPRLVVADGDQVRVDGMPVDLRGSNDTPAGVPGLFQMVRRAIAGDRLSVTYDAVTGIPISMDSDPMANAVDDELSFQVTGWTLDPPDDALLGRVSAARLAWQARSMARYTMTLRIDCDCVRDGQAFQVTVGDGDPVVTSGGRRQSLETLEGVPLSVEGLFDFATSVATNGRSTVEFDPDLRYPARISSAADPAVAGQAETITVTAFHVG